MTAAEGGRLPKYARVAAAIRQQIADGALRPGQPAPSGAELGRATGFSTLTCRRALRTLIADGILVPGPSPNARPRVADPRARGDERDLADATRALSAGLADARRAAGLTQVELAALAGVSVTTVGHAETGRTWQSRRFWEGADTALCASGALLRLHDAYRAAGAARQEQRSNADSAERTVALPRPAAAPPAVADPPAATDPSAPGGPPAVTDPPTPDGLRAMDGLPAVTDPAAVTDPPAVTDALGVPAQAAPSRIMIVWTDGTVTTVHPPNLATRPPSPSPPRAREPRG
jgi:DNA-binding transcriptional regulator YhcF (GntR family)